MKPTYIDLLIDSGEIVRLEIPSKHEDECREHIEHSMKTRDWFHACRWEGCSVTYLGTQVEKVNMGRVVAML